MSRSCPTGTYELGPEAATLTVCTGRRGAAARVGHDLKIEVASWSATLTLAEDAAESALALTADARSLRVLTGTGGVQPLADTDKARIERTINTAVLRGGEISFHSTQIRRAAGGELAVKGQLNLLGRRRPLGFPLAVEADGRFSAAASVVQTTFGLKPYSGMFGALKVADEVEVAVTGTLPHVTSFASTPDHEGKA